MRNFFLVTAFCATAAYAQVGEISLSGGVARYGGGRLGTVDTPTDSGDITMDGGFRLALRFTLNPYRFMGHEFGYGYSRGTVKCAGCTDVSVPSHQGFYSFLMYATPEGSKVRPFAAGGIGFSSFFPPGSSIYSGNQITKFGINYGGGIKVKLNPIWGMRIDFRQFNTGKPFDFPNQSGRLLQTEISIGASFTF
jgi:opacity protein-like surface antigen